MGAVKISVFQMHKIGVSFNVAFRRETFAAKFTVVLDVGMHRLDVLCQGKVVCKTLVAQSTLVSVDS